MPKVMTTTSVNNRNPRGGQCSFSGLSGYGTVTIYLRQKLFAGLSVLTPPRFLRETRCCVELNLNLDLRVLKYLRVAEHGKCAEIPDLASTQEEYLIAKRGEKTLATSPFYEVAQGSQFCRFLTGHCSATAAFWARS